MTGILMKYSQIYNKNPEFQLPEPSQLPCTGKEPERIPALVNPDTITYCIRVVTIMQMHYLTSWCYGPAAVFDEKSKKH
jgi:hypothetical protein